MKFLLLSLCGVSFAPQCASILNNVNLNSNEESSQTNLDDIQIDAISLNVFDKTSSDYNQVNILLDLLGIAAVRDTKYEKELIQIIDSITDNTSDWIIIGMPASWPDFSTVDKFNVSLEYAGSDNIFTGVLQFDAELANINSQNNLKDIFANTNLELLSNPKPDDILDKLKVINGRTDILNEKLKLVNVTYEECDIIPADPEYFSGTVHVTYHIDTNLSWSFASKLLRTDAYNSSQDQYDQVVFDFTAGLGKDALLATYKSINFTISGYTWDNKNGTDTFNNVVSATNVGETKIATPSINLSNGGKTLISREYSNVNNMSSTVSYWAVWFGNMFQIVISCHTHSYATAWNALWARAEAKYTLNNYHLVK
jgi:hypothetical protein